MYITKKKGLVVDIIKMVAITETNDSSRDYHVTWLKKQI